MRIAGYIEHPLLKITVFRMDGRTSVKFETEHYEQTFKLGSDERFDTLEKVQKLVDTPLIDRVLDTFRQMHGAKIEASARTFPLGAENVFEEII